MCLVKLPLDCFQPVFSSPSPVPFSTCSALTDTVQTPTSPFSSKSTSQQCNGYTKCYFTNTLTHSTSLAVLHESFRSSLRSVRATKYHSVFALAESAHCFPYWAEGSSVLWPVAVSDVFVSCRTMLQISPVPPKHMPCRGWDFIRSWRDLTKSLLLSVLCKNCHGSALHP